MLLLLSAWNRRVSRRPPDTGYNTLDDVEALSGSARSHAIELLQAGRKIEAIKGVRESTGWGLKRSKEAVESLKRSHDPAGRELHPRDVDISSPDVRLDDEVRRLLDERRNIEAVKLVREVTGWGLKESKEYVERIGKLHLDDY